MFTSITATSYCPLNFKMTQREKKVNALEAMQRIMEMESDSDSEM